MKHDFNRCTVLVLGVSLLCASSAPAANLPREHDSGFFLRLSAGGGGARTELQDVPITDGTTTIVGDVEQSGPAADVNFAIGAIVSPNLAIHATLAGWSVEDADVKYAGIEIPKSERARFDTGLGMFGGGVTYYLMPANIYLSGSIGAATIRVDSGSEHAESDTGVAVDLTAGKEWWVGSRWGLGVAVGANLHSIPGGDAGMLNKDFKGSSFALRFSATMN